MQPLKLIKFGALCVISLIVTIPGIVAQTPWSSGRTTGTALTIKLVTIDPGDDLYAWWGHTGLIVEDRRTGYAMFYDYGRFSFKQDKFYRNFVRGRLFFQVGAAPAKDYLNYYRRQNRNIRIQTLDIRPDARLALARLLDDDVRPENNVYLYDHYYDNCATRPRDIIDSSLSGALREAASNFDGTTFREETRRFTSRSFFVDFVLMYLMSDVVDKPITGWETMFLPSRLEEVVASTTVRNPRGVERPIVIDSEVYNEAVGRQIVPAVAPPLEGKSLLVALLYGSISLVVVLFWTRRNKAATKLLGANVVLTGIVTGVLGSLLFFMSMFTDQSVTYGNENLIYTNPASFLLLVTGIALIRKGDRRLTWVFYSTGAFTIVIGLYAILKLFIPDLDQENWAAIGFFGIVYAMHAISACVGLWYSRHPNPHSRFSSRRAR